MTITFSLWWIPTGITIISCGYCIFIHDDGAGYGAGLGNMILLIPALFISMLSWIFWGVFK